MEYPYYTGWRLSLLNLGIGLGTFIQILDSSIANVSIPYIAGSLSVSVDEGTWVITSFAASNAIVLPLTGWLSNYFGMVRLFVWSVILFALVSVLCGLSTSLGMIVTLRAIQGAVAGSLIPLSQSLIVAQNPPEKRSAALGMWASIVVTAPVVGPIIGGYLTYEYSWPWIFFINLPIGLFSAAIVWIFLKERETKILKNPMDWIGLILLATGVGCLQIMLDRGKDLDWFESNVIIALTMISLIALGYFFIWNNYQRNPLIDFSFFRSYNFTIGTVIVTIGFLIYFGSTVTIPLWLQTEQGYTAFWAGVAVAPVGIASFLFSSTIGKNIYRVDARHALVACCTIFALGFFYQVNFLTAVDIETIMLTRFLQGFGVALFFLPTVVLSFVDLPKEKYASASGLYHFIRILVGSGFGTSLTVYLWNRREILHYSRIGEGLTAYNPLVPQTSQLLDSVYPQITQDQFTRLLNSQVEQQAFMLATNDLSWLGAWLFVGLIPLLFLAKPVKGEQESTHSTE